MPKSFAPRLERGGRLVADSKENVRKITCPHCGSTYSEGDNVEEKFRYLEDIVCYRRVQGLSEGKIVVDGMYESGEGYDDGTNPRFECRKCLGEFEVPEWVLDNIEWS